MEHTISKLDSVCVPTTLATSLIHFVVIQSPLTLVKLTFQPSTFTFLPIDGTDNVLIIAGGQLQEAELHLHH